MRQAGVLLAAIAVASAAFAAPNVVVIASPKGMVQTIGGAGTADSFTVANVGDSTASVTFQQNGAFFTLAASGAVLAPGATQTIGIQGLTQSSQAILAGSVTITGNGAPPAGIRVAVRLMAGPVPAGTVSAQPSIGGLILYGPANQQHSSAVSFHNSGNAAMQGMAVGDTAWLVPQTGFVNVGPGQNGQASFTVDSTQRPDAASPMGGAPGTLSLRFLSGNATSQSVSVSIVDVVSPTAMPGEPPPLAPGELALFLPAMSSRLGVITDLFLSGGQGDTAVTDLKMYYAQAVTGSASILAAITQPASSPAIWFPSILQTVFNGGQQAGSIQLRGAQTAGLSLAAIQAASPGDGRLFSSPLPVLRSDRSIGAGEALLLTGVEKSNALSTNIELQETSGSSTVVKTDFLDANGAAIGSGRSDTVAAFRSLELLDIVPAGAASVRMTDMSGGRLTACAIVSDNATSASWAIVDSNRNSPTGTTSWVIPVVAPSGAMTQADVFVANESASSAQFTLEPFSVLPRSRHRAVGRTAVSVPVTLAPLQTADTPISATTGLFRLSAPSGTMSAAARVIVTVPGTNGASGASFPVVPVTSALQNSQSIRFTGVDDTQGGLRSALLLAEVGGAAATVRVVLHYVFVAGAAVSSQAVSTKDYAVNPGQLLVVQNLASDVIGSLRASIGDLHNMQADVEVTGGSGSVIPFLEGTDASSGNVMVRAK